jgi:calcineurin-like phosphoesterase family protein
MNLYEIFLKSWLKPNGTIWIFSDPHFKDEDSLNFRGKAYPGDDDVVKRINSKVGNNDTIIFLGDIGDLSFIKKVKGYKVLIMGNHEKGASNYKRDIVSISKILCWRVEFNGIRPPVCLDEEISIEEAEEKFGNVKDIIPVYEQEDNHLFDEVYEGPLMVNDRLILSHEPIIPLAPCFFNIHGHDHSCSHIDDNHMNVCAEAINYTPINLLKLLKDGLLKNVDSIHRNTIDKATEKKKHKK